MDTAFLFFLDGAAILRRFSQSFLVFRTDSIPLPKNIKASHFLKQRRQYKAKQTTKKPESRAQTKRLEEVQTALSRQLEVVSRDIHFIGRGQYRLIEAFKVHLGIR